MVTGVSGAVLDEEELPGAGDDSDWFRCGPCDGDIAGDDEDRQLQALLRQGAFGAIPGQLWPANQGD